jgi:predicted regulator of Ras-like GTPase activity (Roadblock/LC7/MglB family)
MNSHHIIMVMGHSRIKQIVMQTQVGSMVLADFGKGILVTLTSEKDPAVLTQLSETISSITGD